MTEKLIADIKTEIQFITRTGKILSTRITEPYMPLKKAQDRIYPLEPSYNVYLTGVLAPTTSNGQCNFIFSDGSSTQYKASVVLEPIMIPEDAQVRKIVLWYNNTGFLISI